MYKKSKSQQIGLFIAYEGVSQIVESQLIAHADYLSTVGIGGEVWLLCGASEIHKDAVAQVVAMQKKYKVKIKLFRTISHNIPLSPLINALILLKAIISESKRIVWIHARTEYSAMVAVILKVFLRCKLIYDVRGDTFSEIMAGSIAKNGVTKMLMKAKAVLLELYNIVALMRADHILFVSIELRNLYGKRIKNKAVSIIPCLADHHLFHFDACSRRFMRRELGYSNHDLVIGYMGSAADYQCVAETMQYMLKIVNDNERVKVLIITNDKLGFLKYIPLNCEDKFTLISSPHEHVNKYLNTMDYAFLMRRTHRLNFVSSPIKYAEYSMMGIKVLTTNAVAQVKQANEKLKNCVFLPVNPWELNIELGLQYTSDCERYEISRKAEIFYSREHYTECFYKIYSKVH